MVQLCKCLLYFICLISKNDLLYIFFVTLLQLGGKGKLTLPKMLFHLGVSQGFCIFPFCLYTLGSKISFLTDLIYVIKMHCTLKCFQYGTISNMFLHYFILVFHIQLFDTMNTQQSEYARNTGPRL